MKTPATYSIFLSLLLFLTLGCNQVSQQQKTNVGTKNTIADKATKNQGQETGQPDGSNTSESSAISNDDGEAEEIETAVIDTCGNADLDLIANIRQSAVDLSGTPYVYGKTDCSGMFYQVLDRFRDQCPNAILPSPKNSRSSRDIAAWYDKNGTFKIIRDPSSEYQLIKPGMVMFFGHTKRASQYNYQTMTIDTLRASKIGVNHIAIVTTVTLDENGVLQSYEMFHGLNKGKTARVTTAVREHSKYPTYGNYGEPWLAVAEVLAPGS